MSDGGKGSSPRPFSVSQETFGNNFDAIFRKPDPRILEDARREDEEFELIGRRNFQCGCYNCMRVRDPAYTINHMIVCPACGNKRCPHATDHNLACTNSNEPGQPGSRY